MKLVSLLVSCLFLFGGSAAAFVVEGLGVLPPLSLGASAPDGGDQTAAQEDGNSTASPDGNATASGGGDQTAAQEDGNATADPGTGNATAGSGDGNGTAPPGDGNVTAPAENGTANDTAPPENTTVEEAPPEGPGRQEDVRLEDEGTAIGKTDRTWTWRVAADPVEVFWVRFEVRPALVTYMAQDLEIVLRDGDGRVVMSLDAPGTVGGDDPVLEYRAEGEVPWSPGLWSLEFEADDALADYELEIQVLY